MPDIGTPSFDQLRVFLTVVETGSFAAAGRKLGQATSAISYTIANLELQLGVPLFDRDRTRKPTLTEAGAAWSSLKWPALATSSGAVSAARLISTATPADLPPSATACAMASMWP